MSSASAPDRWCEVWDSGDPHFSGEGFLKEVFPGSIPNSGEDRDHVKQPDCLSTFAWVLSVLAVCPAVADKCVTELPESLRSKDHMRKVADRYRQILGSRLRTGYENFLGWINGN